MKKSLIYVSLLIIPVCTSQAHAWTPYISGDIGMSSINASGTDWGSSVSIAAGLATPTKWFNMRSEFEFSYLHINSQSFWTLFGISSDTNHDIRTEKYVANFYIDMLQSYRLKPYVGIGLGYIHFDEDYKFKQVDNRNGIVLADVNISTLDDAITYGIHAGTAFKLTDHLLGNIGAKFFEARLNNSNTHMYSVNVGLRYMF